MEWVLILLLYTPVSTSSGTVVMTTISGFGTQRDCESAGRVAITIGDGVPTKSAKFVCVLRK